MQSSRSRSFISLDFFVFLSIYYHWCKKVNIIIIPVIYYVKPYFIRTPYYGFCQNIKKQAKSNTNTKLKI